MIFSPFDWIALFLSVVLQVIVAMRAEANSMRYCFWFMTFCDLVGVCTRPWLFNYWWTLWIGRAIAMSWLLWIVPEVEASDKSWAYRGPAILNLALLPLMYWPRSESTTLAMLESYRTFGFGLALLLSLIFFIAVLPEGDGGPMQVGLIGFLALEMTAAAAGRILGWQTEIQLLSYLAGMMLLAACSIASLSRTRPGETLDLPPDLAAAIAQSGAYAGQ